MKKLKVLNSYKLLFLLGSYLMAVALELKRNSVDDETIDKNFLNKINLYSPLLRVPIVDKLIDATYFSDIDSITLKNLLIFIDQLKYEETTLDMLKKAVKGIVNKIPIPNGDIILFKKIGVTQLDSENIGNEITKIFISERFFKATIDQLKNDLKSEMEAREIKIERIGVVRDKSVDDSLLVEFNKKLSACKNFDNVEDLLLTYTTAAGSDFINGFLRGDMSALKSKRPNISGSWDSSLNVSFDLLLESAIKAIQAKGEIVYGKLRKNIVLYRGLGIDGLLKFINVDKNNIVTQCKRHGDFESLLCAYINRQKPIYQTNSITSTSLNENVAFGHAKRNATGDKGAVLMKISVKNNSTFGKNFKQTTFGSDDYNEEVILKPNQKIKLNSAICAKISKENLKKFVKGRTGIDIITAEIISKSNLEENSQKVSDYIKGALLLVDCKTV